MNCSYKLQQSIVKKFPGRLGRGTGSSNEGRYFVELWYEGGIPVRNENPKFGTWLHRLWVDDPGTVLGSRVASPDWKTNIEYSHKKAKHLTEKAHEYSPTA